MSWWPKSREKREELRGEENIIFQVAALCPIAQSGTELITGQDNTSMVIFQAASSECMKVLGSILDSNCNSFFFTHKENIYIVAELSI